MKGSEITEEVIDMQDIAKDFANELKDPGIFERFQEYIIAGAVNDYYKAVGDAKSGKRRADVDKKIAEAKAVIEFFRSEDFTAFSGVDGEVFIINMRKKAGTTEYAEERIGD